MSNLLFIAAGGGGDALTTLALTDKMEDDNIFYASFSWDRKIYDPDIGPRSISDFENIKLIGKYNAIINGYTRLKNKEAISFLPLIAREYSKEFYLLDYSNGIVGLRNQVLEIMFLNTIDGIYIVDVGGDILASGDERNLKSPLADSGILSACNNLPILTRVLVAGCGLDGELTSAELKHIITSFKDCTKKQLETQNLQKYLSAFNWLPSEASALFLLSCMGLNGKCEIRQDGYQVELDEFSSCVYNINYIEVYNHNEIAKKILSMTTLNDVQNYILEITGKSELDVERKKIVSINQWFEKKDNKTLLNELLIISEKKKKEGIKFLTKRRICELLKIKGKIKDNFIAFLQTECPDRFIVSIWKV